MPIKHEAFGWRKYECPVPLSIFSGDDIDLSHRGYLLWYCKDAGQYPHLNRWQDMEGAFLGFVSRGHGPPIACAYSITQIGDMLSKGELMSRHWIPGADAAEAVDFITKFLLGVWMGEKTPFLVSVSDDWDAIIGQITPLFVL